MHDDAMTHAKWECDNGQMQERYVHYDAEEMFMRCMISMHLWTREPGKSSLLTCAFGGAVPHVCS